MLKLLIIIPIFTLGLSACSLLERTDSSGYASGLDENPSTVEDFYREKRGKAWNGAREELGILPGHELTEGEVDAIRSRVELSRLEKNLTVDSERKQYYSYKPYFRNDADRVAFLKLPDRETRERWARIKGLTTDDSKFDSGTSHLIENSDVAKGMSRTAVKQSWGEPDFVESAGDPLYGNERWKYKKQVSTDDGYKQETRIIYFESGRVVGWETL